MEWMQFVILILAMTGMFFWNRTEARSDSRHFDNETKEIRREMIEIMRSTNSSMQASVDAMRQESKDFHGRLCAIEERRNRS